MPQFRKRIAVLAAFMLLVPSLFAGHALAAQSTAPQGEDPPGADDDAVDRGQCLLGWVTVSTRALNERFV